MRTVEEVSAIVVDTAYHLHRDLGPGLLESVLAEDCLAIELKSVEVLAPVHAKQVLTYLRLLHQPLGLLINFGAATFKEGVRRIVNSHTDFTGSTLRINHGFVLPQRP